MTNKTEAQKLVAELTAMLKQFPMELLREVQLDFVDRWELVRENASNAQRRAALLRIAERAESKSCLFDGVLDIKMADIELSTRSAKRLKNYNVLTIGDLAKMTEQELLRVPNFGRRSLDEVKEVLAQMGLTLAPRESRRPDAQWPLAPAEARSMTDHEIKRRAKQVIQEAVASGSITILPGGYVVETGRLTDEHRRQIAEANTPRQ